MLAGPRLNEKKNLVSENWSIILPYWNIYTVVVRTIESKNILEIYIYSNAKCTRFTLKHICGRDRVKDLQIFIYQASGNSEFLTGFNTARCITKEWDFRKNTQLVCQSRFTYWIHTRNCKSQVIRKRTSLELGHPFTELVAPWQIWE